MANIEYMAKEVCEELYEMYQEAKKNNRRVIKAAWPSEVDDDIILFAMMMFKKKQNMKFKSFVYKENPGNYDLYSLELEW